MTMIEVLGKRYELCDLVACEVNRSLRKHELELGMMKERCKAFSYLDGLGSSS